MFQTRLATESRSRVTSSSISFSAASSLTRNQFSCWVHERMSASRVANFFLALTFFSNPTTRVRDLEIKLWCSCKNLILGSIWLSLSCFCLTAWTTYSSKGLKSNIMSTMGPGTSGLFNFNSSPWISDRTTRSPLTVWRKLIPTSLDLSIPNNSMYLSIGPTGESGDKAYGFSMILLKTSTVSFGSTTLEAFWVEANTLQVLLV